MPIRILQFYLWRSIALVISFLFSDLATARQESISEQERLRGSITPEREWWDVKHYDLRFEVFPETKSLRGSNKIRFTTLAAHELMQIDLQPPLEITKVLLEDKPLTFERNDNVYLIQFPNKLPAGTEGSIEVFYQGEPVVSRNPPWSGGLSWQKDEQGNHFIASSCQGIGASIWWANKDHGYDEPDEGINIRVTVPETLSAVSNGRLTQTDHDSARKTKTFHWQVTQPINNYGVNVNIGNYVHFADKYEGEFGTLDLDYWVLADDRERAGEQFKEAPRTIEAFEHWFGKYPFYEDSYKLVAVPYLGMEHQSSVTYGNGYVNGYRGRDLSATGVGLKFDFIIVHESGHEWFGNNISMKDAADMWIHESFTNYAENLFVEYHFTEKEAQDYVIGCRKLVRNESPIIGTYNANRSGSGDMYYKGGNMLHSMRQIVNDDEKWRSILRGLNTEFWHQTVTTEQIESYMSKQSGIDFSLLFDQYLRGTKIPNLKHSFAGRELTFQWENVVADFAYPVDVIVNGNEIRITPTETPQTITLGEEKTSFEVDRNFYVTAENN
jgi:aminopeptidase N